MYAVIFWKLNFFIDTYKILSLFSTFSTLVPPVLSCVKRPNRSPTIICSAEGFYPAALEQQWMRDGEIINSSYLHKDENYSTNPSGSLTQMFYQELPSQMFETIFSCWVNHSSLNKPLSANLSSTVCYDQRGKFKTISYLNLNNNVLYCIFISKPIFL